MPDQLSTPISVSANRILAPLTAARSAYRLWLDVGNVGTLADFLESLRGPEGLGAYEIAVNNGFVGTEAEWLESLTGAGGAGRVVRNSSFTASNGSSYSAGGVLTVSDPEPAEGAGYNVLIRSGIVTVGGVAYSSAGAVLERIYHAGAWVSYLYEDATHYQSALVSGVTIKTINNIGLLGSGNITIAGDITSGPVTASAGASVIADNAIEQVKINGLIAALNSKQATLSNYSTISALAGYPNSFPTTWSQVTTGVTNHIPFSVSPASLPTTEGTVSWNSDDHTLNIATDVSGVVLQVGQEQHVRVRNTTGSTISNGAAVYLSGASGQRPTVALADADNDTHVASTIGLATADIAHNAFGYVTVGGLVRGVNTTGMTEGGPIYLSGTAGGLTQTAPTSNVVRIGFCVVAGNNGTILVHVEKMSVKSADVLDASTGGNGAADSGKLVKFGSSGQIEGYGDALNPALYGSSDVGDAVVGSSTDGTGIYGNSVNGVGGDFTSDSGTYHAKFGYQGDDKSAIERVRGWFVWFYSTYVGRLKTADITANRDWTLPDASGTVALTSQIPDISGKQDTLTNYSTISALTGYPSAFTPLSHTHAIADITDWPDALTRDVIGYAIVGPSGEGNISTIEDTDSIYGARADSAFVSSISNLLTWVKGKASTVFSAGNLMKWAATADDTRTNLGAQATLVSGTNIKTVASQSILGSTNIPALLTDPTGITGAAALTNIVSLTQAQYDAIGSKSSTTLYVIT